MTPTEDLRCASVRPCQATDRDGFDEPGPAVSLEGELWDAPLAEFAASMGVSLFLYDREHRLVSGPHLATPLAEFIQTSGLFQAGGRGWEEQRQLCAAALGSGERRTRRIGGLLEIHAVPVVSGARCLGVFVYGWTPVAAASPDAVARFAALADLAPVELQRHLPTTAPEPPHAECGRLLQALAAALLGERNRAVAEQQRAASFALLSEVSLALNAARCYEDVAQAFKRALKQLLPGATARIFVAEGDATYRELLGPMQSGGAVPKMEDLTKIIRLGAAGVQARMPLLARDGARLGALEVDGGRPLGPTPVEDVLAPLATQLASALETVRLLRDEACNRAALDRAVSELRRASRLRDEFLATLSHELRTPMNAVLGWCQLLRTGALERQEHDDALRAIERNASVQMRLVDDLLELSQEVTGQLVLERRPVDLMDVLRHSVAAIRPAAEGKALTLRVECQRSVLPFVGDAPRLQQAFWHLLANAVKFTPEGGLVKVTAEVAAGRATIRVRDTGKGIRAEFLDQVFDCFAQEDGSYTRRFGGLGLGLSIVRHLIELHGGEVSAVSDGEGLGSTFTVILPLNMSQPQWLGADS